MEWKRHPIINVWINYIVTRSSFTRNLCHIWARKLTQFTLAQKIGFSNYILYLCIQIQGQYDAKWLWPIRCTKFCDCVIPLITNGVREMFGSPTHRKEDWKSIFYVIDTQIYILKCRFGCFLFNGSTKTSGPTHPDTLWERHPPPFWKTCRKKIATESPTLWWNRGS